MSEDSKNIDRRTMLKSLTAGAIYSIAAPSIVQAKSSMSPVDFPSISEDVSPQSLAINESFWARVAPFYDTAQGIVNLEHGYWGKMSRPVQEDFVANTRKVNTELSYYARKHYADDQIISSNKVAEALGAKNEELVLTRNATESIHNLIRQYNALGPNDAVLYTDIDYPSFKDTMQWLATSRNIEVVEVVLPAQADQKQILLSLIHI